MVWSKGFLLQKFIVQVPRFEGKTGKPEVLEGVLFHQPGHYDTPKLVYTQWELLWMKNSLFVWKKICREKISLGKKAKEQDFRFVRWSRDKPGNAKKAEAILGKIPKIC